ncbi:TlpA family protein disulfide reductase [Amorphoplanes digitatis]|uniref:Thiol-disulfide isomerase/thioredoxin n=1 Tax=Actinoplanes digitatis TaxID=1868 RepID=A0A7W7HWR5_9ACTN|nr:redoxin domain-containing protein [Actinoplanes digitatis]MBB4762205.1 thiol-disulfide isomerase/thioredoxin [Actinoplanes digitatis]
MTVPRIKALIAATVAAGALAGCGSAATPPAGPALPAAEQAAEPAAADAGATEPPEAPAVVPASLKFKGRTLDGKTFDAATMAGKPTILWFWAPWCATCASEAQSISDLSDEYAGRLNILGIAGMGGNKDMHEFVSDLEVGEVPHLDDGPGKLWKKFGITEQSTYVILDRAGKVVVRSYLDDLQLTTKVKSLVA